MYSIYLEWQRVSLQIDELWHEVFMLVQAKNQDYFAGRNKRFWGVNEINDPDPDVFWIGKL
jgi:hypothetical protein